MYSKTTFLYYIAFFIFLFTYILCGKPAVKTLNTYIIDAFIYAHISFHFKKQILNLFWKIVLNMNFLNFSHGYNKILSFPYNIYTKYLLYLKGEKKGGWKFTTYFLFSKLVRISVLQIHSWIITLRTHVNDIFRWKKKHSTWTASSFFNTSCYHTHKTYPRNAPKSIWKSIFYFPRRFF